jgi:hypothetical protein
METTPLNIRYDDRSSQDAFDAGSEQTRKAVSLMWYKRVGHIISLQDPGHVPDHPQFLP